MMRKNLSVAQFSIENLFFLLYKEIFFPENVLIFACSIALVLAQENLSTLKFVNVLYRHGDRSPTRSYKLDLHNESSWPQGYGQLTQVGMREHFELGQWLRNRYDGFISTEYQRHELRVWATNYDRTIQSAQSNLAGLYPAPQQPLLSDWTGSSPAPVFGYVSDHNSDPFAGTRAIRCPRAVELQQRDRDTDPEAAKLDRKYKHLYEQLSNLTGEDIQSFGDFHFYDVLFCESRHNLTTPEWSRNATTWRLLTSLADHGFRYICLRRDTCRLVTGQLLKSMLNNMRNITESGLPAEQLPTSTGRRMVVYSAHDTNQAALLQALGVFNNRKPPYTSTFIMELHWIGGQFVVKLLLKNGTLVTRVHELTLSGCPVPCPWERFLALTADLVPGDDWMAECGLHTVDMDNGTLVSALVAVSLAFAVMFVSVLCLSVRLWAVTTGTTRHQHQHRPQHDLVEYSALNNID